MQVSISYRQFKPLFQTITHLRVNYLESPLKMQYFGEIIFFHKTAPLRGPCLG